jgi:hypothetical protein
MSNEMRDCWQTMSSRLRGRRKGNMRDSHTNIVLACCCGLICVCSYSAQARSEDAHVGLLRAYAQNVRTGIESVDLVARRTLEYPLKEMTTSRVAQVRIKADKVRCDETAQITVAGADGKVKEITQRTWTSAYDGEVTRNLPTGSAVFTISPGNAVEEYGLFFQGAYMGGQPLHEWLDRMDIVYKSVRNDADGVVHIFEAVKDLPPAADGKPRSRRWEMAASEKYGFAIASWTIHDQDEQLLADYHASEFQEVAAGVWLPTHVVSSHYMDGQVTRKDDTRIEFKAVNAPMDDGMFHISAPPHYTIVDRVNHLVINPSEFRIDPMSSLIDASSEDDGPTTTAADAYTEDIDAKPDAARRDEENGEPGRESSPPQAGQGGPGRVVLYRGLMVGAVILALVAGVLAGRTRWRKEQ